MDSERNRDGRVNVRIESGEIISCSEESDYMYKKLRIKEKNRFVIVKLENVYHLERRN